MTDAAKQSIIMVVGVLTLERIKASGLVVSDLDILTFVGQGLQEYVDYCDTCGVKFEAWGGLQMEVRDSILRYADYRGGL